jgi:hypothetical protein
MDLPPVFYLVWRHGTNAPTVVHHRKSDAVAEAKRLARENPLHRFHVLQAIGYAQVVDPVQWVETLQIEVRASACSPVPAQDTDDPPHNPHDHERP